MNKAERPSALIKRLRRVSPLVERAIVVAVAVGVITTAAIVGQAIALANVLGGLFHHAKFDEVSDLVLFSIATLVRSVTNGLAEPVTSWIAAPLRRDLRRRLLEHVLRRGPFESIDATVQLATRGVDAIESYVAKYVPSMFLASVAPVLLLGWLAATDWWSFTIVIISVLLLPLFMILLGLEAKAKMEERWKQQQQLAGYFGDVVRGMTVLKSFNRSEDAVDNLEEVGVSLRNNTMATLRVAFMSSFALELLSSLATALVALVLGLRLLNGSLGLNVALAVLLVTPEVFLPLRRSAAQFHASADGIAAASQVLDILDEPLGKRTMLAPVTVPSIELRDVIVALEHRRVGQPEPVSSFAPAGSLVRLSGPSGIGKTTLLKAMAGLVPLASGQILVNGVDVGYLREEEWHRVIGWLPQDPHLPGNTVRDIVNLGDSSISDDNVREALAKVRLDFLLDRETGEGARSLSAGQRRRLALARCLVRRPLLLLLDEPTAHLDGPNALVIEQILRELSMTRIVATHGPFIADVAIELRSLEKNAL